MARATAALFHSGASPKTQQQPKNKKQQPQERRTKRVLDASDRDLITANTKKKTRVAVEVITRHPAPALAPAPAPIPASASASASATKEAQKQQQPTISPENVLEAPTRAAASETTAAVEATAPPSHLVKAAPVNRSKPVLPPSRHDTDLLKHQKKVINGIKHELDWLQPKMAATKKPVREPGRKLRSQEATRFKSDLSAYFPDYDEVIGNEPKEQHLLNLDTPIIIVDSSLQVASQPGVSQSGTFPVRGYGDALFTDVCDAQKIDFGFLEAQHKNRVPADPLPDSTFEPMHRRAERVERSIRNTERGRAQHEKDQIIRLLESLQGHDWLRVMGVSGITETKKKRFEPARAHFIKGCQAILDKFKNWSQEEKRRKLQKERALAEQAQEELREAAATELGDLVMRDATGSFSGQDERRGTRGQDGQDNLATSQDNSSEASSSSPAKQLRQEAMARSKSTTSKRSRSGAATTTTSRQNEAPKELTSFFKKKHERDSALNPNRRAGRKTLAWGHTIPYIAEADFDLPEHYRDDEMLKSRARKRRRDRRSKP